MLITLMKKLVEGMERAEARQAMRETAETMRSLRSALPGGANYLGGFGIRTQDGVKDTWSSGSVNRGF